MFDTLKSLHRSAHEFEALTALDRPSGYSGLRPMDERNILFQLVMIPAFEPYRTWTVYQEDGKPSFVRRITWQRTAPHEMAIEGPKLFGADGFLVAGQADYLIRDLETISVPAFSFPPTLGIDGTTFGVRRMSFYHRAELFWWSRPPQGWEALSAWYHRAIESLNAALPEPSPTH